MKVAVLSNGYHPTESSFPRLLDDSIRDQIRSSSISLGEHTGEALHVASNLDLFAYVS